MIIKHRFNRLMVRFRRASEAFKSTMDQKVELDEVQVTAFKICKKMICNHESELIYAPITHTYYVENEHYYIRMSDGAVSITNGKFSYYVWLPEKQISILKQLFDRISQTKSNQLERRYSETTLENLKEISRTLETPVSLDSN
jgi:hypothetical protein